MRHHVHALRAGVAAGLLAAASSTAQTIGGPEGRRGMAAFVRSSISAVVLPSGRTPFDLATGSGQPRAVSRVQVWTYMAGTIDPADRDRWTQVADALLEPAGVIVDWHL